MSTETILNAWTDDNATDHFLPVTVQLKTGERLVGVMWNLDWSILQMYFGDKRLDTLPRGTNVVTDDPTERPDAELFVVFDTIAWVRPYHEDFLPENASVKEWFETVLPEMREAVDG